MTYTKAMLKKIISKSIVSLLLGHLCFLSTVHAQLPDNCECIWQGSFSKIVEKADLIVSGQILALKGNSADFSIQKKHFEIL